MHHHRREMEAPLAITVQGTPNPNAVTCTLNRVVTTAGRTYRDPAGAEAAWAKRLLQLPGVTQGFALNNFVSVNKTPEADWNDLIPKIQQILTQTLT